MDERYERHRKERGLRKSQVPAIWDEDLLVRSSTFQHYVSPVLDPPPAWNPHICARWRDEKGKNKIIPPDCRDVRLHADGRVETLYDGFFVSGKVTALGHLPTEPNVTVTRSGSVKWGNRVLGHPKDYENMHLYKKDDLRQLVLCPTFKYPFGCSLAVAQCFTETRRRYSQNPQSVYDVLVGGRLLPPSTVLRWEWQRRVIIDPKYLSNAYAIRDPKMSHAFASASNQTQLH